MINELLLFSDMHLTMDHPVCRTDDVQEEQDRMLRFIAQYALGNGVRTIVQAGDMTDQKRSWELLPYLSKMLRSWKERGLCVYTVLGQHDSYYHDMTNEKTVMGVLISSGLVTRLTMNPVKLGTIHLYGSSYGEKVQRVGNPKGTFNILAVHAPILWKKIWSKQEDCIYAPDFLAANNYDVVICGDQHQKFIYRNEWHSVIMNTGPMMRLDAREKKHQPGFYHYNIEKGQAKWVPLPYAEDCISTQHLERKQHQEELFEKFTSTLNAADGRSAAVSFDKSLREHFKTFETKGSVQRIIAEEFAALEGGK